MEGQETILVKRNWRNKDAMINQEGGLPGYGTVYFHQNKAANIISFYRMTKKFKQ
jgi:hypothetical protein